MDGRMDGWMDGWMDGRTDGWMNSTGQSVIVIFEAMHSLNHVSRHLTAAKLDSLSQKVKILITFYVWGMP